MTIARPHRSGCSVRIALLLGTLAATPDLAQSVVGSGPDARTGRCQLSTTTLLIDDDA